MEKKEEMELETAKNLVLKHMISELNLMPSPGKEDKSKLAMFFTQTSSATPFNEYASWIQKHSPFTDGFVGELIKSESVKKTSDQVEVIGKEKKRKEKKNQKQNKN